MGIVADTVAEAVERSQSDPFGVLTDLRVATGVEFVADTGGKVWVNVDGTCVLRIDHVETILVDTSATPSRLGKVIRP